MIKILIKGFYGFGNFGDDILMITTYNIVRQIFPDAEIYVDSQNKNPSYIHKLLSHVKIINSTKHLEVDWTIHGGGGVFFDFTNDSMKYYAINQVIKFVGYKSYRHIYKLFQSAKGRESVRQHARAGLGIGIGTYTQSSKRFFSDILALSNFDILFVRDDASLLNARRYIRSNNIHKSSDLAFLAQHWMPEDLKVARKKNSIAVILRDWAFDSHVSAFLDASTALLENGHDVKFFAFDENADKEFINAASAIGEVTVWKPAEMTITHYLSKLAECKLTISSRAHGAIVSACLAIPVCCISIEPKLEQVALMLNNGSRIIRQPFTKKEILNTIENMLRELPQLSDGISGDVARNNKEMSDGISRFGNFVSTYPIRRG